MIHWSERAVRDGWRGGCGTWKGEEKRAGLSSLDCLFKDDYWGSVNRSDMMNRCPLSSPNGEG